MLLATQLVVAFLFILLGSQPRVTEAKGVDKNRPRHVEVKILNATTVTLDWQPPRHVSPSCPIKRYLIRLKAEGDNNAKRWRIDGARESLTLHDLAPSTTYNIRLVAVTCRGKSAPSRWTTIAPFDTVQEDEAADNRTETRVPGKPTNVRTRTFSDSVIVSWFAPRGSTIVRGYMVGYGEGVPDVNWQYVSADTRNITIANLKSATQYVISLRAFNNFGKGQVIYDLIYTREAKTGPTVGPFSPPVNIKAKILSPTTAWLQWTDPTLGRHQQIPDNRYYNVHYQAMPSGKIISMIVRGLTVVLYDLTPGTDYSFKVRTVKDAFSSPFSFSVHNRTFEEVPGSPPRDFQAKVSNETTSVRLKWRPPRQPNGEIHGYHIMWTTTPSLPEDEWEVMSLMGEVTEMTMIDLKMNASYFFRVQARNSKGYSPLSPTIRYNVTPGRRGRNRVRGDNDDNADNGESDTSEGEESGDSANRSGTTMSPDAQGTPAALRSGIGSTWYMDNDGDVAGEYNTEHHSQMTFISHVQITVSASISWAPTSCDLEADTEGTPNVTYLFQYHQESMPDALVNVTTPTRMVVLQSLEPNKDYKYRVRAVRSNGTETPWSDFGTFNTKYT